MNRLFYDEDDYDPDDEYDEDEIDDFEEEDDLDNEDDWDDDAGEIIIYGWVPDEDDDPFKEDE